MTEAEMFNPRYKIIALTSVTAARVIYSLNWFTLSPGLYQVANDFHASLQSLGILESAFLVGAGVFQIPSAYAASKWNAKLLVVLGLSFIALANGLGAVAPNFDSLVFLRFLLGVGAAMFFSPAIVVVAPLFRNERQGFALGIYNAGFSLGGAVTLFGWAYIDQLYGWRIGLLLGAILAAIATVLVLIVIKRVDKPRGTVVDPLKSLAVVLRNRQIWLIGFGLLGMWSGYYAVTQFLPFYDTKIHLLNPDLAGILASVVLITPIPGSVLGGWLSDRLRNRKAFMLYSTIIFGVAVALIGPANFSISILLLIVMGFMDAFAFTAMYAAPFQIEELTLDQKAISLSLMNAVQISGGFILPLLFTGVAATVGYSFAWVAVGIFVILFAPLFFFVREPFRKLS